MRTVTKAVFTVFLLLALTMSIQFPTAHSQPSTLQVKSLNYIKTVLPFDLNQYAIVFDGQYTLPSPPDDPIQWDSVAFILKAANSTIHVVCVYVNGVMRQCGISFTSGSPIIDRSYSSMAEQAAHVLVKHGEALGVDSANLVNLLPLIDETNASNATQGDIALSVSKMQMPPTFLSSNSSGSWCETMFDWMISYNGVVFYHVSLNFHNGVFSGLQDDRAAYPVGGTEVDISKEQAIEYANQYLSNYTSKYNLTVAEATATLSCYPRGNTTLLYPMWSVLLDYGGNVASVSVYAWADTGEVFYCYQSGSPLNINELRLNSTPAPTQAASPQQTTSQQGNPTVLPQPTANSYIDQAAPTAPLIDEQQQDAPATKQTQVADQNLTQILVLIVAAVAVASVAVTLIIRRKNTHVKG
jgi:hypothetical protein